jgi:beta-glucosidase
MALQAARKSLILLKNNGILPLKASSLRTVALLGPNSNHTIAQNGDWVSGTNEGHGQPRNCTITVLDGLKKRLPNAKVLWELGACIEKGEHGDIPAALAAANQADVTIVVIGDRKTIWGEKQPTATLELQGEQLELLDALVKNGKKFVIDFVGSKPLVIPEKVVNAASAIICQFSPGMLGGQAFAEALVGDYSPGGRLPISWPRHAGQIPVYYNAEFRGEHGGYADLTEQPQWAFGYGLTYSTFVISDVALDKSSYQKNDVIIVTMKVENSGPVEAVSVVQVYVHDVVTSVSWPKLELKAFERVVLGKGESREVKIKVPVADLAIVDSEGWRVVEPGNMEIWIGQSSYNIIAKRPFVIVE